MDSPGLEQIGALSALGDPVRRRLYEHVAASAEPVGRDAAATATGVTRSLAAYHLDRLADEGLLTVAYARRSGRTGPGAGRPAKLYARPEREFSVAVPPRDYGLAARLLAEAAASDPSGATAGALRAAAERLGREAAGEAGDVAEILAARGYEPYAAGEGVLRMRNCPFHAAAQRHPEVVCDMNLSLVRGLLGGLGTSDREAVLEPAPGRCCVALRRR
jgi:predicted ArsR family transcriptional regulator